MISKCSNNVRVLLKLFNRVAVRMEDWVIINGDYHGWGFDLNQLGRYVYLFIVFIQILIEEFRNYILVQIHQASLVAVQSLYESSCFLLTPELIHLLGLLQYYQVE